MALEAIINVHYAIISFEKVPLSESDNIGLFEIISSVAPIIRKKAC